MTHSEYLLFYSFEYYELIFCDKVGKLSETTQQRKSLKPLGTRSSCTLGCICPVLLFA